MSRETLSGLFFIIIGIGCGVGNVLIGRWNHRRFNHRWAHPAVIISAIGCEIFAVGVISFGVVDLLHLPLSQESQAITWLFWMVFPLGFGILLIAAVLDAAGRVSTARINRRAAQH